jgi:hypothetical protein
MGPLIRILICMALLGVVAAPAAPAAEPEEREGFAGAFQLKASNGYSILAFLNERRSDGQGFVNLFVVGDEGGAIYSTRAKVTAEEVRVDLGRLGEIDLDFVPSGRRKAERSACDPQPVKFDAGHYEGTIEFRGEEGYTRASATRVPLVIRPLLSLVCGGGGGGGETLGSSLPGARLRVFDRGQARRLSLQINANRPGARMSFEATTQERRDGIDIFRAVEGVAPGSAFDYDPLLSTATLDPPAPFSGSAGFHRNALPANRWTGNLAIDFPGRSGVPLTGSKVRAGLVHAHLFP